jgi:hypothetical protein
MIASVQAFGSDFKVQRFKGSRFKVSGQLVDGLKIVN